MEGTTESFDAFVARCLPALGRTAYLLTGDRHLAEDLLQTALAKTYLRWHRLREPAAAEAYVRRVMVSTITRWRRRRWRGEIPSAELPDRPETDTYGDADTRDVLRRALAALPAGQRAVLVLRYYEDLSEEETARVLGCSRGTVKSRASRALAALRDLHVVDSAWPPRRAVVATVERP